MIGEGWRGGVPAAERTLPATFAALVGGMMEGGRVDGRVSPAWQSVIRRMA